MLDFFQYRDVTAANTLSKVAPVTMAFSPLIRHPPDLNRHTLYEPSRNTSTDQNRTNPTSQAEVDVRCDMVSYDSQGYGASIPTRLHSGCSDLTSA
jgi:hypothetical protein